MVLIAGAMKREGLSKEILRFHLIKSMIFFTLIDINYFWFSLTHSIDGLLPFHDRIKQKWREKTTKVIWLTRFSVFRINSYKNWNCSGCSVQRNPIRKHVVHLVNQKLSTHLQFSLIKVKVRISFCPEMFKWKIF